MIYTILFGRNSDEKATYKTKDVTNKTGIPKHMSRIILVNCERNWLYEFPKPLMSYFINLCHLKFIEIWYTKELLHYKKIFQKRYRLFLKEKEAHLYQVYKISKRYKTERKKDGRNLGGVHVKTWKMLSSIKWSNYSSKFLLVITQNRLKGWETRRIDANKFM